MSKKFIFQAATQDSHLDEIRATLEMPDPLRIIISVAFLSHRGFSLLSDLIAPHADKAIVLAGIRNGITSAQGLLASVNTGCKTYAVDTGSRGVIFHPKLYLTRTAAQASLVLGSANLTVGGLNSNIEASVRLLLDLKVGDDAAFVADVEGKIDGMIGGFPQHVIEIADQAAIEALLRSGRVVDERVVTAPTPGGSSGNRDLDAVPKMQLNKKSLQLGAVPQLGGGPAAPVAAPAAAPAPAPAPPVPAPAPVPPAAPVADHLQLVWQSNPLTRRPLNIPTAAATNPTGSMFFTKGQTANIDQRHYFREEVFGALPWAHDTAAGKEHLERARARFRIVIKDVNYGVFEMQLTHDSRLDSPAYAQNNSLTQLHWGDVKPLVAKEDLLDRTLYLYRDEEQPDLFVIEID
ncbi:phospholipase D family protein [Paracoccus sp. (in: a-proteobacteria)]|uniref:phospholipase D family protein n=1 Tax=Paracoccus sp. TaxID=267 RepID=UPI00321FA37C